MAQNQPSRSFCNCHKRTTAALYRRQGGNCVKEKNDKKKQMSCFSNSQQLPAVNAPRLPPRCRYIKIIVVLTGKIIFANKDRF